jgi:tRNA (cytidine32/uridine32-2'-O)-methyltransferase
MIANKGNTGLSCYTSQPIYFVVVSLMLDFNQVSVVLVNTSHPGNIGAAARAMKNMGLTNLVLVQPEDFPSGVAVGRAVSAGDLLDNARVVSSLEEAVEGCGLVIGTSARSRTIPWPMLTPEETANKICEEAPKNKVALVFGREDAGLNNEELQQCHFHVQIPTADFSSLNLAAAVMVICYEVYKKGMEGELAETLDEEDYWDKAKANGEQVEHFYRHLEKVMIDIDFHDPENPRQLMQRMRRLFSRIRIDEMEMNILRGILTNIEYKLGIHPGSNNELRLKQKKDEQQQKGSD